MIEIAKTPIKTLIVDDSPVVQELIAHILSSDPGIKVIGTANNGEDALKFLEDKRPDVILMDIYMPKMNGYEATRMIMETRPVPIIIVSADWNPKEVEKTFFAMEAGAVAVLEKPRGSFAPRYEKASKELVETVRAMSEVRLVKRLPARKRLEPVYSMPETDDKLRRQDIEIVAIGASTGGPPVLQTILSLLSKNLPVPVLIVQHIAKGFVSGLADWLNQTTGFPVKIAAHGEYAMAGHVYIAPDGFHMGVERSGRIALSNTDPDNGLRPSVSYLFRSVSLSFGPRVIGILLTGMGKDGAEDLKIMKERGAATIAQDKGSSVVFGMPGEAINIDAADYVLPPEKIAAMIERLAQRNAAGMEKNSKKD